MTNLRSLGLKHTAREFYFVYSYFPSSDPYFKGRKTWYPYKTYSTMAGALAAIRRIKNERSEAVKNVLSFRIVWNPYPFCSDEECYVLYDESEKGGIEYNETCC